MTTLIVFAVFWLLVPVILLVPLGAAVFLTKQCIKRDAKISAIAGFLGALILVTILLLALSDTLSEVRISLPEKVQFSWFSMTIGLALGVAFLFALNFLFSSRLYGVLVFLLSFSGLFSLYCYFFLERIRSNFMFATLGLVLGAFLFVMFDPKAVSSLLRKDSSVFALTGDDDTLISAAERDTAKDQSSDTDVTGGKDES